MIQPKYRLGRHLLLIAGITIIALNQTFSVFNECIDELVNKIYGIFLIIMTCYLTIGYYNLYILVPRYMLEKKYAAYIILFSLSILFGVFIQGLLEFVVDSIPGVNRSELSMFNSPENFLIDNLSGLCVNSICIFGLSTSVFFKHWITNTQEVAFLEKEHIRSEVEQLKDQITPLFLFNILNRTAITTTEEPEKASDMLMKLSLILRYQLYDSAREKVLLKSEINFLRNYLNLQQLYYKNFGFIIEEEGDLSKTLIPPLLLNPFIQCAIDKSLEKGQEPDIEINFIARKELLIFECSATDKNILFSPQLENVKKRLSLLFPQKYKLEIVDGNKIKLQLFF